MHPEAYEGFRAALAESGVDPLGDWRVLDIGGQHVNGSVHDLLPNATITTLDLENANIIADARTWQPTERFDIVIATEVFEHVEEWDLVLRTMVNAVDLYAGAPGLLLITCASTNRPPHGATGAPLPAPGEWYANVNPFDLDRQMYAWFRTYNVQYQYPPGDLYAWGRL